MSFNDCDSYNNNTSYQSYINNTFSNNNNVQNSYDDVKQQETQHKQNLLQNVMTQMSFTKPSKFQQLLKRRQEDQKYLQDMENCFPFGRGGGGAPIRDKNGFVVAARRAFISNPKYNLLKLNVNDDYYDVWDKGAFKHRYPRTNNSTTISYDTPYNSTNFFANTAQRSLSQKVLGGYNNNNTNFTNPLSNSFNCINNQQHMNYMNNGQSECCNCGLMETNQNGMDQQYNSVSNNNNNRMNVNYNNGGQTELTLSYDNYELNNYQKQIAKNTYRNELLAQIEEKKRREQLERERKRQEDLEEEERLRREQEELERKLQEEENRKKQKYSTSSQMVNISPKKRKHNPIELPQPDTSQDQLKASIALNEELLKLREQMQLQNDSLYNQINILRQETQAANMQRYQTLQEIARLQNEIKQNNEHDEIRKKYIYDVISSEHNSYENDRYGDAHIPDNVVDKVEMIPKKHKRRKNNEIMISNGNICIEDGIKTESKLFDTDMHNAINECDSKDEVDYMEFSDGNENYCKKVDVDKEDKNEALEIKRIYNKNVHRLHHLNEFESMLTTKEENNKNGKSINNLLIKNYDNDIEEINPTFTSMY